MCAVEGEEAKDRRCLRNGGIPHPQPLHLLERRTLWIRSSGSPDLEKQVSCPQKEETGHQAEGKGAAGRHQRDFSPNPNTRAQENPDTVSLDELLAQERRVRTKHTRRQSLRNSEDKRAKPGERKVDLM